MTKQTFCKKLFILAEMFDVPMSGEKAEIYWERLKDYDDQQLEETFGRILDTCKFFPKIAEIKELIEGSPADKSLQAWQLALNAISKVGIYNSPQFEDKRITAAILDLDGWEKFCNTLTKDLPWKEKEFRERYNYHLKRPIPADTPDKLVGLIEANNRPLGYNDHRPDRDWWEKNYPGQPIPKVNCIPEPLQIGSEPPPYRQYQVTASFADGQWKK